MSAQVQVILFKGYRLTASYKPVYEGELLVVAGRMPKYIEFAGLTYKFDGYSASGPAMFQQRAMPVAVKVAQVGNSGVLEVVGETANLSLTTSPQPETTLTTMPPLTALSSIELYNLVIECFRTNRLSLAQLVVLEVEVSDALTAKRLGQLYT